MTDKYLDSVIDLIKKLDNTKVKSHQVLFAKDMLSPTMGTIDNDLILGLIKNYKKENKKFIELSQKKLLGVLTDSDLINLEEIRENQAEFWAMILHGYSLSDLSDDLYNRLNLNPNSLNFWFNKLQESANKQTFFKIPETKIVCLPIELAQYIRHDFQTETNQESRDEFNRLLFNAFKLDENKEYFIKTGLFSSKFEFQNAHIDDPKSIGDYFHVINNNAMQLGTALTNDLVVREWIPDTENRPTIYDGMPLRTEFRAFIDCDLKNIIDIVPYWNNKEVMNTLDDMAAHHINNEFFAHDKKAFHEAFPTLNEDFNNNKIKVMNNLQNIVDNLNLSGCWSLDIMKSGNDFYLIDMAQLKDSALLNLVDFKNLSNDMLNRGQNQLPAEMPFQRTWAIGDYQEIKETYFNQPKLP